jgi:YebC/PmpR family DNA-binding regulatory protein
MSGHNKWSSIKHKKGAADAKRGKIFTRIIREIAIAARMGGGDPGGNPRLRTAIAAAKDANMPKDNVERAIKKGTGELEGASYEDFVIEGYGAGGVAIIVEGTTDNKNRSMPEIRHLFGKYNGNMGETGCVAWMFETKGVIYIPTEGNDEDTVMECALEAGAEDMETEDDFFQIKTPPESFFSVREALEARGVTVDSASIQRIPTATVALEGKDAEKALKLYNALEDHDDVSNVYANFEIDDELIEQIS